MVQGKTYLTLMCRRSGPRHGPGKDLFNPYVPKEWFKTWSRERTIQALCAMQVKMVYDIFSDSGVLEWFKIEERKIMAFIAAVCSHYHKNPYHNFCHVVYVLHCTYMFLMRSEIAKSLSRVDQLVLLIAALCHDVDHDGERPCQPCSALPA